MTWATRDTAIPATFCALSVPDGWSPEPGLDLGATVTQRRFRGPGPADVLVVEVIDRADPTLPLRGWVDATLALTGLPMTGLPDGAFLVEWGEVGVETVEGEADELLEFRGLVRWPGPPAELSRAYVVLVRCGDRAWNVALSIMSACLPGDPEEIVEAQDHARAAAVLDGLRVTAR